jgi:hypothetical protein
LKRVLIHPVHPVNPVIIFFNATSQDRGCRFQRLTSSPFPRSKTTFVASPFVYRELICLPKKRFYGPYCIV